MVTTINPSNQSITNHAVQVGAANNVLTSLGVGATGTVLQGSTGADPAFTATPTLTSVTFGSGNALDTYATGTWTPTMVGQSVAGTTTYTGQAGFYTRIGNLVMVTFTVTGSGATGTGNALFGGLPFTIKNQSGGSPVGSVLSQCSATWVFPAGTTSLSVLGNINAKTFLIYSSGTASTGNAIQMANAAFTWIGSLMFQV